MTPRQVLEKVLEGGGRVIADPAHPRLLVPPELKPLVAEHREAIRKILLSETEEKQDAEKVVREVRIREQVSYAFPWPDSVPLLGPRQVGPFSPCTGCGAGSWVKYGVTTLCLSCAKRREASANE